MTEETLEHGTAALLAANSIQRLDRMLRHDVHAATAVRIETNDPDVSQLILSRPGQADIAWHSENGEIRRRTLGTAATRETYRIRAKTATWIVEDMPTGRQLVSLVVRPVTTTDHVPADTFPVQVTAEVGRDLDVEDTP